jgi:hypothetical protein
VETIVSTLDTSSPSVDTRGFSKEEVETFRKLMSRLETSAILSSFAYIVNWATALNASATHSDDPWVIDFGASDHLVGMSSLFSPYNPCFGKEKLQ